MPTANSSATYTPAPTPAQRPGRFESGVLFTWNTVTQSWACANRQPSVDSWGMIAGQGSMSFNAYTGLFVGTLYSFYGL